MENSTQKALEAAHILADSSKTETSQQHEQVVANYFEITLIGEYSTAKAIDYIVEKDKRAEQNKIRLKAKNRKSSKKFACCALVILSCFIVTDVIIFGCWEFGDGEAAGIVFLQALLLFILSKRYGITWLDGLFTKDSYLTTEDIKNLA